MNTRQICSSREAPAPKTVELRTFAAARWAAPILASGNRFHLARVQSQRAAIRACVHRELRTFAGRRPIRAIPLLAVGRLPSTPPDGFTVELRIFAVAKAPSPTLWVGDGIAICHSTSDN